MKKLLCSLLLLTATAAVQATPVYLWASTENAYLVRVDALTGDTFVVGNTTLNGKNLMLNDIAIDRNGDMWGITHTSFYRVDRHTGALTFIGNHTVQSGAGLGIAPDGFTVLAVGSGTQTLFSINTATGASTGFTPNGMATEASGDIASFGNQLFMTSSGDAKAGHRLAQIDPVTGQLVGNLGPAEYGKDINGVGIWPAKGIATGWDGVLYIGSREMIYAIPTSGPTFGDVSTAGVSLNVIAGALVAPGGLGQIRGLASEVPEPGTLFLLGAALATLGLVRRNR
jgi:hypothetical protein